MVYLYHPKPCEGLLHDKNKKKKEKNMKKVLSVLIVSIMIIAIFVSGVSAEEPVEVLAPSGYTSGDVIMNGAGSAFLTPIGNEVTGTHLGALEDTGFIFYGWHANPQKIVEFGYRYGDNVVMRSPKFYWGEAGGVDDSNVAAMAPGLGYNDGEAVRFYIMVPVFEGPQEVYAVVKLADGTIHDMWRVTYNMEPTYLFDGDFNTVQPGFWMNPFINAETGEQNGFHMDMTFNAVDAFNGMYALLFANKPAEPEPCVINVKLYNESGKLLEDFDYTVANGENGDGRYTIPFARTHNAGKYTICVSQTGNGAYFVFGGGHAGPNEVELDGFYGTNDFVHEAPAAYLTPTFAVEVLLGDVNGDGVVNNKDVVVLFRYVSDDDVEGFIDENADVNGDGKVNNKDVVALFRLASYPAPVLKGSSFNTVWVDGTQICDVPDALAFLRDNPITDAQKIGVRGWAYIGDYATLRCFGYSIDGGEPVFNASYTQERADVQSHVGSTAYYANGFSIQDIDVSGLAGGAHTLTVYAKGSDGTNVKVVDVPFKTINLMTVNYDALYYNEKLFFPEEGSIDKKIFALQDKSVLNFETGTVENIRVRGWVRVSEDVADIAGFGYSLDGGAVVYDESFVQDRAAELADANFPGGQGFNVLVPVKDLAYGEHTIDVYVKTSAGKEIKVVKVRGENDIRQVGVTFTAITYKGFSIDSLKVSGNEANLKTEAYLKKGDTITVLGWAAFSTGLKELVYEIDGVRYACSNTYRDRGDVCQVLTIDAVYGNHAGFGLDTQLMALTGTENLDLGEYTLKLIAVGNGGLEKEIKTLTLKVTENGAPVDPAITHTCVDSAADSGSAISGAGWTGATYAITALGYTVDGGDPIFTGVEKTTTEQNVINAAGEFATRFSFNIYYGGLDLGQHTIQLVCLLADEDQTVLPLGNVISQVTTTFTVNVENEVR